MAKPKPWFYVWKELVASKYGLSSKARLVALTLANRMRPGHEVAWPSQELLAMQTGYCERTVRYALTELLEGNWLTKSHRGRSGVCGYHNVYHARIPPQLTAADIAGLDNLKPAKTTSSPASSTIGTGNGCREINKEQNNINRDDQDPLEKFQSVIMEADEDTREQIGRLIRIGSNNSIPDSVIRGALKHPSVVNSGFTKTPLFLRVCREIVDG